MSAQLKSPNSDQLPKPPQSALVLGGGFAGVETAIQLRRAGLSVTLVSDRPHLFVYPTSIWVVTGEHRIEQDLMDLKDLAAQHRFELLIGKVESVDATLCRATIDGHELTAEILVLAVGAGRKKLPGMEHTVTIWGSPKDTVTVSERLNVLIQKGEGRIAVGFGGNPADPSAIRGGPAFEVMFNIVHLLKRLGLRERFELSFFAPMPSPGARMGDKAAAMVRKQLEAAGVKLHFGKKLEGFDAQGVNIEGGSHVDADLVVYVPGGAGHPQLANSGLPLNEAGFIRIDGSCAVDGYDNVYAVGDVAALQGPEWRAKQGHLAEVMARVAASAIASRARGELPHQSYLEHMSIICLMDSGNGAAFVHRDARHARVVPLPIVGHWLKKAWGYYYRFTKCRLRYWLMWAVRSLFSHKRDHVLTAHH
jgi:sulfide:quinone oxidoreductase